MREDAKKSWKRAQRIKKPKADSGRALHLCIRFQWICCLCVLEKKELKSGEEERKKVVTERNHNFRIKAATRRCCALHPIPCGSKPKALPLLRRTSIVYDGTIIYSALSLCHVAFSFSYVAFAFCPVVWTIFLLMPRPNSYDKVAQFERRRKRKSFRLDFQRTFGVEQEIWMMTRFRLQKARLSVNLIPTRFVPISCRQLIRKKF